MLLWLPQRQHPPKPGLAVVRFSDLRLSPCLRYMGTLCVLPVCWWSSVSRHEAAKIICQSHSSKLKMNTLNFQCYRLLVFSCIFMSNFSGSTWELLITGRQGNNTTTHLLSNLQIPGAQSSVHLGRSGII